MLPRERVIAVINHKKPDRVPVYAWVKANLKDQITEKYGSVENFEDKYEFDMAHLFGEIRTYTTDFRKIREGRNVEIEPERVLDEEMNDPDQMEQYQSIIDQVKHHKEKHGRFVYIQTPGIFESNNDIFGIENHLAYLLLYEEQLKEVYIRQAEWNKKFAMNCLDLGVDMIHVSDDWGAQNSLMFRPETWWKMIFPYHKITCDAVKQRKAFLSLHSDGNINEVLDGVVKLGYDVVHPFQESAGMDFNVYKQKYRNDFVLMGGLDVQTTIGFGKLDFLKSEIERVLTMFKDGGMLYCTSHFIQDHCSMEELTFAYDFIYETTRKLK
jgi:uroporphyrinogen decarboxylase